MAADWSASLASVYEGLTTPVWLFDPAQARVIWANQAGLAFWEAEDLAELGARELDGQLPDPLLARLQDPASRGPVTGTWTLSPKGRPKTVRCTACRIDLPDGRSVLRVEAHDDPSMDAASPRVVEAMRHTPVMVSIYSAEGELLHRNPSARAAFRGLPDTLAGHFSNGADGAALANECRRTGWAHGELSVPTASGEHWHAVHLQETVDPVTGEPMRVLSETDISTRKETEEQLKRAEEHFRAVVEQALVGIYIFQDGLFRYANPRLAEILGVSQQAVTARPISDFVHREDLPRVEANIRQRLEGEVEQANYRFRGVRADGAVIHVHVHGARIEYQGRPAILGVLLDVTEQSKGEEAVRASEERLREITDQLATGILVTDRQGRLTFMNPAAEELLGWSEEELLGKDAHATFHQKEAAGDATDAESCPIIQAIQQARNYESHEDRFRRKDGTWVPVALKAAPLRHDHAVIGAVTDFHDIRERLDYQRALREEEERYRMLFNSGMDALLVNAVRPDGSLEPFSDVNDTACELLGHSREELFRLSPQDLEAPDNDPDLPTLVQRLTAEGSIMVERVLCTRSGERVPVDLSLHLFEFKGRLLLFANARDIRERKQNEARIYRLAHYDTLTGLPNRVLLAERMDLALSQAARFERCLAVLFIDLDGFKPINDRYGHDVGDELLREIAERLQGSVREGDTACRWSGDEFIVVLTEIADARDAERVAGKLLEGIERPAQLSCGAVQVSASIGVALYPGDGTDRERLITAADAAMYEAKHHGKGCVKRPPPRDPAP